MHKSAKARFVRIAAATMVAIALGPAPSARVTASESVVTKLDSILQQRAPTFGRSRVVLRAGSASSLAALLPNLPFLGARLVSRLQIIDAVVLDVPNFSLPILGVSPHVRRLSIDRPVFGANERTGATVGATAVRQELGYDGTGVGVAIVDSGISAAHDDLSAPSGGNRVARFVDFVGGQPESYDDYGHGTHVAGIVAGNGFDSTGARTGMAPGAHLVVLKVLDGEGQGRISDVIAALGYVVDHKDELNIRIVNLSIATSVSESYETDPLTLAAQRAVAAGIVVVAAAGNNGRGPEGTTRYSGITAPGNAPWVVTVGASSHMGTADRADDTIAAFSSRGPGAIDYGAKPDLVAPGVGIESLSDPMSRLYATSGPYLLSGTVPTSYLPYLSQSGTSMAAPVATGTIALMLQANPGLTPNLVKAILQYTAQSRDEYDPLTQGAGFLNAKGAVELSAFLAAPSALPYPSTSGWSRHLIWGHYMTLGGRLTADANAWSLGVTWGDGAVAGGDPAAWGITDDGGTWQMEIGLLPNVVWGTTCGGGDCIGLWDARTVAAVNEGEADTVVWGTSDQEGDTVVWGTSCTDPSCAPVVWPGPGQ
jgi:subtilisin family serine protease